MFIQFTQHVLFDLYLYMELEVKMPDEKSVKEECDIEEENDDNALQVLAELFRTVLQSVRNEHPHEVLELVQKTVSACLEEYYDGAVIPIPLLDELLVCIGQGEFHLYLVRSLVFCLLCS